MLTDPGVILGPIVIVRFVDEESEPTTPKRLRRPYDLVVGDAGRETLTLPEGARLKEDVVDVLLPIEEIPDDVLLGGETVTVRPEVIREDVRLELIVDGVRLELDVEGVRLGGLTVTDRLGAAELRVVRVDGELELGLLDGRESDLDVLRVDTGEAVEVDGVLAFAWGAVPATGLVSVALTAGFGVGIGVGLEAACGVSLTMGLDAVDFGVALTMGLETAGSGVDLTIVGLGDGGFGADLTAGAGVGALTAGLGAVSGAGLGAAFGAGSGLDWGAGLGAASGAGLGAGASLGAAFAWGAAGLAGLLLDSSAKAGATQVITAKANAISRTFASYCNLMINMIGLLSSLSGFFTCQDSQIQGCRSIYAVLSIRGDASTGGNAFSWRNRQFLWLSNGPAGGIIGDKSAGNVIGYCAKESLS